MIEIYENCILVSNQKEVSVKAVQQFWHRLCMFLCYNAGDCPKVVFTSDDAKWQKHSEGERARCFYDEQTASIVFWAYKFLIDNKYIKEYVPAKVIKYAQEHGYTYIIPLTDIYHEMVHHVQYILGDWLYDDLLEATAEHITYIITAQNSEDYIEESVAMWYVAKNVLKLKPWQLYIFIRDAIVDPDFYKEYFDNPTFVKFIAEEYGGSIDKFWNTFTAKFGKPKYKSAMIKDLKKIHNQLFYRW